MHKSAHVQTLSEHFFAKFFQTDTAGSEDAAGTTVVRALAGIATPTLMAGFWIALLAHNLHGWTMVGTHNLFVTYAFCAMGCVTALQWEALFPDRMDFLILLPLPLRSGTLFMAKLRAVGKFLLLFLVAANLAGTLLLPTLEGWSMPRAMVAHAIAVFSAGLASSLMVLTLEATVIVLTPERWFRWVAPVIQTLLVALFVLLFLRAGTVGEHMRALLGGALPAARRFPLLWFDALYEVMSGGAAATSFARQLSRYVPVCVAMLFLSVVLTYPAAWSRRKRMALEGAQSARHAGAGLWSVVNRTLLFGADQRAVFHFIRQTLTRLSRYHVLLAAYCGTGLALSITMAVTVTDVGGNLHFSLWRTGAQGALPLLLFWTVAGLHSAFLLPEDLSARWIFRLAPLSTRRVVSTTKLLVFAVCLAAIAAFVAVLALCGWRGLPLLSQPVFGAMYAMLLTDCFFFLQSCIPFTRPRLPGRSSLPLTLAVFIFGAPVSILLAETLERWVSESAWKLAAACITTMLVHALQRWLRSLPSHSVSDDAFLGENDTDVQTLGLST
jgi:hypothetical protein